MAAAIARHFASKRPEEALKMDVASAGTSAYEGFPATDGAVRALKKFGIDLGDHVSRRLTSDLVKKADRIFCMTPSHVAGVVMLDPGASAKTQTLDPAGGAVDDPIGGSQDVYDETCRQLADLIAARLNELNLSGELNQ